MANITQQDNASFMMIRKILSEVVQFILKISIAFITIRCILILIGLLFLGLRCFIFLIELRKDLLPNAMISKQLKF